MPIDPDVAVGAEVGTQDFSWTSSDVLLYHLAVGAQDLSYTLETSADLQVLPSFAVVAPTVHAIKPPSLDLPGCDINLAQVVHGSQQVLVNGPLPAEGSARLTTHITDVWDKGKAAVIWQEGVATGPDDTELWRVRSSIFVKGEGGWGGDRGESTAVVVPDRSPDASTTYTVTPAAGAALPALRRPQPAARGPGVREVGRLRGADPARPVHLRHRAARGHRPPARR